MLNNREQKDKRTRKKQTIENSRFVRQCSIVTSTVFSTPRRSRGLGDG